MSITLQELESLVDETVKRHVEDPESLDIGAAADRYDMPELKKEKLCSFLRYCINELQGDYVRTAMHRQQQNSTKKKGYAIAVAVPVIAAAAAYIITKNEEIAGALAAVAAPLLIYGEAKNNMFSMNLGDMTPSRKPPYPDAVRQTMNSVFLDLNCHL